MVKTVSYSVDIDLGELENSLHSEFLNKLRAALHVDSLKRAHVRANYDTICSGITFFTIGEDERA